MDIHVRLEELSHEELLVAPVELAHELRLGMIVKMSPEVVHAGKKLATELARHVLCPVRLDVLLQRRNREERFAALRTLMESLFLGVLQLDVSVKQVAFVEFPRAELAVEVLQLLLRVDLHVQLHFSLEEGAVRADVAVIILDVQMNLLDVSV